MRKQLGAVRTNISLPRELKARMDAVEAPVNWSSVAAQAFEQKLLELESKKEVGSMDEVIARLKAADELDRKAEYQDGRKAGDRWAREDARPRQLRALSSLRLHGTVTAILEEFGRAPALEEFKRWDANGISVSLYKFINPAQEADAASVRAFWASALGDEAVRANRIENQDFVLGFCDGALDVWVKVRGKL
jgi:hypothetical protein